jgi:hypothetical protein
LTEIVSAKGAFHISLGQRPRSAAMMNFFRAEGPFQFSRGDDEAGFQPFAVC